MLAVEWRRLEGAWKAAKEEEQNYAKNTGNGRRRRYEPAKTELDGVTPTLVPCSKLRSAEE
jgi:hypothetical protein